MAQLDVIFNRTLEGSLMKVLKPWNRVKYPQPPSQPLGSSGQLVLHLQTKKGWGGLTPYHHNQQLLQPTPSSSTQRAVAKSISSSQYCPVTSCALSARVVHCAVRSRQHPISCLDRLLTSENIIFLLPASSGSGWKGSFFFTARNVREEVHVSVT